MNPFEGKKVLLFSPVFFGYEKEICNNINNKCDLCEYYDERAKSKTIEKVLIRLNLRFFLQRKIKKYYKSIIDNYENNYFDYIIFLNPETITVELLREFKLKQKNAIFVLYMWDSFENKPNTIELLPYFDRLLSFNKNDCEKYNMIFRPLFFIDKYDADQNVQDSKYDIDIGFIGTIHSDRYRILKEVKECIEKDGMKTDYYMFFPSKLLYYKYKLLNIFKLKIKKSEFHFSSLKSSEVYEILSRCKAVVDIQHPKQVGLTMRTIEMLGLRKKLITTNSHISEYDFYNQDNICIINRKKITINKTFLTSEYNNSTDSVRRKYSLNCFTDDLILLQ